MQWLVVVAMCAASSVLVVGAQWDFYTSVDHIVELNHTNIKDTLQDQEHVWAVKFYSSWCPFSQRFVPAWIILAREAQARSPALKLAAFNCVNTRNEAICAQYDIVRLPTIRVFARNSSENATGVELDHNTPKVREELFSFVEDAQSSTPKRSWFAVLIGPRGSSCLQKRVAG